MPSPFPGMDPYLEDPSIFPGFHHRLADDLADRLNAQIVPKYYADVEVRTVLDEISIALPKITLPDVGVYERQAELMGAGGIAVLIAPAPIERVTPISAETRLFSVQVRENETGELVTSIEILSPYNKRRGEGLDEYRLKRRRALSSMVHLVEIDLLRGGIRPGKEVAEPPLDADYILLVNRNRRNNARVSSIWPVGLSEPLPTLPIPLLAPDPDVALELNTAVRDIYARARYETRVDYRVAVPAPPLRLTMQSWLEQTLAPQK